MAYVNTIPIIAIVMMVLGCIFSIIALATDSWGKLDPTPSDFFQTELWSGNWGLFKVCLKLVTRKDTKFQCKSPEDPPEYWKATMAFEILAFICSMAAIPFWCVWVFWPKPTKFPWLKILKVIAIVFLGLTAFWHAVAVSVWNAKDVGPPDVRKFSVTAGFSWGFAIFCIIWEVLTMIPMQLSLPAYKRKKVVKQPTHPLFRPDPEGGGIVIPQDGKEPHPLFQPGVESEDNSVPGFLSKPSMTATVRKTFLDSLPDERNVYVYDEEDATIKPQTVSRNTGNRMAHMMGSTWGKKPASKSKLQLLKETWGKRDGLKFGFGTSSKADNREQNGSVSKITGRPLKTTAPSGPKLDNHTPLFVKSLWNTHFKKDEISDGYKIEGEDRVTKKWDEDTDDTEETAPQNFVFKTGKSETNNAPDEDEVGNVEDISSNEDEEEEENVYNLPSSSEEDETEKVHVPNPNIIYEKKVVERKNFNVPGNYEEEEEEEVESPNNEYIPTPESNFTFKEKVIQRKNLNVSSDEETDVNNDDEGDIKQTKRRAPGIPVQSEPEYNQRTDRRASDDRSSVSDEMFTYSYETGFDPPKLPMTPDDDPMTNSLHMIPNVKLQVDMNDATGESNDYVSYDESSWAKPYVSTNNDRDKKVEHNYQNFAYLSEMADSEHNVTEI